MTNISFDASLSFNSPIGLISIYAKANKVVALKIDEEAASVTGNSKILRKAERQLANYLNGKSKNLNFEVATAGTAFQESVWRTLETIPYGETLSYAEIARRSGYPRAVRAVGGAVAANPVPLRIPCHRVLGSNRQITGYTPGQGVPTKLALLKLEGIRDYTNLKD